MTKEIIIGPPEEVAEVIVKVTILKPPPPPKPFPIEAAIGSIIALPLIALVGAAIKKRS